ncbi:MAG TPA: CDGSH iron-sulfur domain-containing protein [Actinomycetota bacterium]
MGRRLPDDQGLHAFLADGDVDPSSRPPASRPVWVCPTRTDERLPVPSFYGDLVVHRRTAYRMLLRRGWKARGFPLSPHGAGAKWVSGPRSGPCRGRHHGAFAEGGGNRRIVTESSVRAYPDGPLLLRGDIRIFDEDGNEVRAGRIAALCRCGRSRIQPLCDGLHLAGDTSPPECLRRTDGADVPDAGTTTAKGGPP